MTEFERRAALAARLDTLERRANTLSGLPWSAETRDQASRVIEMLQTPRSWLLDADASALPEVERMLDAASGVLASIGDVR
jgi:hypothetical protein